MLRVGPRTRAYVAAFGLAFATFVAPSSGLAAQASSPAGDTVATASSVGLLPVHAIAVDLDALPGVGDKGHGKTDELALGSYVVLAATHESALEAVPLDVLREYAVDVPADPGSLA